MRWLEGTIVLAAVTALLGVPSGVTASAAETHALEQEAAAKIEQLRSIRPGQVSESIAIYNQEMDAAWKFYASNKPAILPILRAQLGRELGAEQPSDLVLLDVGLFLHENDGAEGKAVAREALFRLNPRAPVVHENWKELFELAHDVGEDHDPRLLGFVDRTFLSSNQTIFISQHALQLDGTLICVFLYGAYGTEVEKHLSGKLQDRALTQRVLELLGWLGSPDSLRQVGDTVSASPTYDTFSRATSYMMRAGGPAGRDFLLKLDPNRLDSQSREYLSKVRPAIQASSFETLRAALASVPGDKKLSDADVQSRVAAMMENYGKDDRTSPVAILDSGLKSNDLVSSLLEVRARTLYRLSDEALTDVEVTNAVINALRYRSQ